LVLFFEQAKMVYTNTDKQSLQHKVYQRDNKEFTKSQYLDTDTNQPITKQTTGLDHHI